MIVIIMLMVIGNNDKFEVNVIFGVVDEDGFVIMLIVDFMDVDINDIYIYLVNIVDMLGVVINNGDGIFDYDLNGVFEVLVVGEIIIDIFKYMVWDVVGKLLIVMVMVMIMGENDVLMV